MLKVDRFENQIIPFIGYAQRQNIGMPIPLKSLEAGKP